MALREVYSGLKSGVTVSGTGVEREIPVHYSLLERLFRVCVCFV